jgi:hypothetical protein
MQKKSHRMVSQIFLLVLITQLVTTCRAIPRSLDSLKDIPPSYELTGDIINTSEESSGQPDEVFRFKVFFQEEIVGEISSSGNDNETAN